MKNTPPKKSKKRCPKGPIPYLTSTIPDKVRGDDEPHMVGYARISVSDQNTQRQVDELVLAGVASVDIFSDIASGSNMDRPGWEACVKDLRVGDVLVIHTLDRLSRDTADTLNTLKMLNEKGVRVKILTMDVDSQTPLGKFMLTQMAAFAQFERDVIMERTLHGLAKARARGVFGGTKPKWTDDQVKAAVDRAKGNAEKAAKLLGCSIVTIKRRMAAIRKAGSNE